MSNVNTRSMLEAGDMSPREMVERLSLRDPTVSAALTMARRDGRAWTETLERLVLVLAGEKKALHDKIVELGSLRTSE